MQVNAARLLFERAAHSRDPQDSFKVFNVVRSLRYLVTSTIQVGARRHAGTQTPPF